MTENEIIDNMNNLMFIHTKDDKISLTLFGCYVCVSLGYSFLLFYLRRLKNEKK